MFTLFNYESDLLVHALFWRKFVVFVAQLRILIIRQKRNHSTLKYLLIINRT
jgi:hypothetical protein